MDNMLKLLHMPNSSHTYSILINLCPTHLTPILF